MNILPDRVGQVFNRLTVISFAGRYKGQAVWNCQCICGNTCVVRNCSLTSKQVQSCGCIKTEMLQIRNTKHGLRHTVEYSTWQKIKGRCMNSNDPCYFNYGGRGIKIAEEWKNNPKAFIDYIGPRPSNKHSIDRIDVNGNYEPGNIQWATAEQQSNNRRNNHRVTYKDETKTVMEWSKITGLPRQVIEKRLRVGWPVEPALTYPLRTKLKKTQEKSIA